MIFYFLKLLCPRLFLHPFPFSQNIHILITEEKSIFKDLFIDTLFPDVFIQKSDDFFLKN